jgi:hypothetical protein
MRAHVRQIAVAFGAALSVAVASSAGARAAEAPSRPAPRATDAPSRLPLRVRVVDMIPASLSAETNQDSEPHLTVDPRDPRRMAASAFTPDPQRSGMAPIFTSLDGGKTWRLNAIVPGASEFGMMADMTLRFGPQSGRLYAATLDANQHLNILRATDLEAPGPMELLVDRAEDDQPWIEAFSSGSSLGEHVVVASNNFLGRPKTASFDLSPDASKGPPPAGFQGLGTPIEFRKTSGQDAPSVRAVPHADGTVYIAYIRWTAMGDSGVPTRGDIVVARDDHRGTGNAAFRSLVDPGDQLPGIVVQRDARFPALNQPGSFLGHQRVGSSLSLAVDPRDSAVVYVAWGDGSTGRNHALHLRRSVDRGNTWSPDLKVIPNATNPALAVNDSGLAAFLYQSLDPKRPMWSTHVALSRDHFSTILRTLTLAQGLEILPTKFDPLLGDYDHILAIGNTFYGVFSSANTPIPEWFPYGDPFEHQRYADLRLHKLFADAEHKKTVAPSVDPFFFEISPP